MSEEWVPCGIVRVGYDAVCELPKGHGGWHEDTRLEYLNRWATEGTPMSGACGRQHHGNCTEISCKCPCHAERDQCPVCGLTHCKGVRDLAPTRHELCPEAGQAAVTIHKAVWHEPYSIGNGPMHHAGGPYWHNQLLKLANRWERLAAAARIAARSLPDA